jgi:hypothetical protein
MGSDCEGCGGSLEKDWVACPHCGRPVSGQAGTEKLVRVITKVGVDLLEAGLLQAEADAEEKGNKTRAAQIAIARNLAKDVAPKIADAVTTYVYQKKVLDEDSPAKKLSPDKNSRRP